MSDKYREKYNQAKEVAQTWYEKFLEADTKAQDLMDEVERLKELTNNMENEEQVKHYERTIKKLKREYVEKEENYKNIISNLTREKILYEGRIQQLEEARKDLKERYDELKQDFREQRKKE